MKPLLIFLMFALSLISGCAHQSYLATSDGVKLGYDEKLKFPLSSKNVLFIHGLGESYDSFYYLQKDLAKAGWSTLGIDLRGHGSSKDWKGKEIDWTQMSESGRQTMIEDVRTAIKHLKNRNASAIWLIGASFGANLALQYAVEDSSIEGIVLLSPGFNYSGIKADNLMSRYGTRPVLLAGSRDDLGTVQICEKLKALAEGEVLLAEREKSGHGSEMIITDESLRKDIVEWMTEKAV